MTDGQYYKQLIWFLLFFLSKGLGQPEGEQKVVLKKVESYSVFNAGLWEKNDIYFLKRIFRQKIICFLNFIIIFYILH